MTAIVINIMNVEQNSMRYTASWLRCTEIDCCKFQSGIWILMDMIMNCDGLTRYTKFERCAGRWKLMDRQVNRV